MNGIVMDFRLSLFGSFDLIRNNVLQIVKDNPLFISYRVDGNENVNGLAVPVFLLETKNSFIRIGNNRVDLIFKSKSISDDVDVITPFSAIKNMLPISFFRIAINYSYNFINESDVLLKHFMKESNLSFGIKEARNFNLVQAFSSVILTKTFNNIISIQTGRMINRMTFETKQVVSCLIDVNSVPAGESSGTSIIKKDEVLDIFNEAKKIAQNDFEKVEEFFRI